ncbi:MAG: aminotransferase class IV [Verrucomicrobium sp.]|nr:aminotransferase class IV [Verrucomicrobium sp.]
MSFLPWLGLFETLRVKDGAPLEAAEHWETLRASAAALAIPLRGERPERSLPQETGRWRWIVDAEGNLSEFFSPEADPAPVPYRLALAPQRLGSRNWDARHKTISYLTHWQARRSVEADEAVLLNEHGLLATGAMSNLFWVKTGRLHTPRSEAGCRTGVVRGWVLRHAAVEEGDYPAQALDEADEIFVTNSWIGIRAVCAWNGRTLATGPVTAGLIADRAGRASRPPGN